ncbi:MAG: hypothetical protein ABIQ86_10340 [Steroidobacteraceae bacterium]
MNSMFSRSGFAAAFALAALAGCNAVEDVRTDPFIDLPTPTVVLYGKVAGLGSVRQLVLTNNNPADYLDVYAPVPTPPTAGAAPVNTPVLFSFGTRAVRDAQGNPVPYNIQITRQPYGKICSFRAGTPHSGTLSTASPPPEMLIDCIQDVTVPTYDLTVDLDSSFANSQGAKVRLTTEEGIYDQLVTAANISSLKMTFVGKLFNGGGAGAGSPLFKWTISASTAVGGIENRCPLSNPTNRLVGTVEQNPTANIGGLGVPPSAAAGSAPWVRACTFTIGGAVHYSRPAGVAADPALGAGLTLELRRQRSEGGAEFVRGTATVPAGAFPVPTASSNGGIAFTFNNTDTALGTAFTSNADADFQVVVTNQPAGQTCIIPDGGYVSLRALVQLNPTSITGIGVLASTVSPAVGTTNGIAAAANQPVAGTRLILHCRNRPSAANALNGIYRLTKTVATFLTNVNTGTAASPASTLATKVVTSKWVPFDLTVQNTASNNVITFFDDGTFLYGSHHNDALTAHGVQVEHGFYDYSATLAANDAAVTSTNPAGRLRFTLHTDTHPNTTFPAPNTVFPLGSTTAATCSQGFNSDENNGFNSSNSCGTDTPGISALPGALVYTTVPNAALPVRHSNLGNVMKTAAAGATPARITGTAGPYGGTAASNSSATFTFAGAITAYPPTPAAPTGTGNSTTAGITSQVDWELTEVPSIDNELTGGFISQDHRRFFTWDKTTTYGNHIGVNGLTNLAIACFVTEDFEAPTGTWQRRDARTFCTPINRPRLLPEAQTITLAVEAQDDAWLLLTHAFTPTAAMPASGGGTATANVAPGFMQTAALNNRFPNFEYRLPGANSVLDGRYPSPVYYYIAPAASFSSRVATTALAAHFPAPASPFITWCTGDILGLRPTQNSIPFRLPVYLCRQRAQ